MRLFIRGSRSLKEKRHVLRKIKDKIAHHFHLSVAEVADNDDWKSAVIATATVGNDAAVVQSVLDQVARTIEGLYLAEILAKDTNVRTFSDEEFR